MEIEEALYFFRKNKNLKQKEILTYTDNSVYSRIETGKKLLKFSELRDILARLSVPLVEFSEYLDDDIEQKKFRELLQRCGNNPNNTDDKNEMLAYFQTLSFSKMMKIEEMSNYIVVKTLFSSKWEEIPPLKQSELALIFDFLCQKNYFFQYDYALLSNTIFLFEQEKRNILAQKALPVKNINLRNTATKEFIKNMVNNLITTCLRKKEYVNSSYYLSLAQSQVEEAHDLSYKIVLNYLSNLTNYFITKNEEYKNNIFETIEYLNKIGEQRFSASIEREVQALLSEEEIVPIFIQADL